MLEMGTGVPGMSFCSLLPCSPGRAMRTFHKYQPQLLRESWVSPQLSWKREVPC